MTLELEVFHMILPGAWLGAVERQKGSKEAARKLVNKQQHQELKIPAPRAKSDWRIRCEGVRRACLDLAEEGRGMWKYVIIRSMLCRYNCVNLSKKRLASHPDTPEKCLLGTSFL